MRMLCLLLVWIWMPLAPASEVIDGEMALRLRLQECMRSAVAMAAAEDFDDLIASHLTPTWRERLEAERGKDWRTWLIERRLRRIAYYFGNIDIQDARLQWTDAGEVILYGRYDCYAQFVVTNDGILIDAFGQDPSSM